VGAAPAETATITGYEEYNVTDTQTGLSSEELGELFPKLFKPAEPIPQLFPAWMFKKESR
jgi:hypothetical protein